MNGFKYKFAYHCKHLTFIDNNRINNLERTLSKAFLEGGYSEVRKIRFKINSERKKI